MPEPPPVKFLEDGEYSPSVEAWRFHTSLARFRYLFWGVKSGKCLHSEQGVLTADGRRIKAAEVRPGDRLLASEDGKARPCTVLSTERTSKPCVELTLADGSTIRCSADHRFPFWNVKSKRNEIYPVGKFLRPYGRFREKRYWLLKPQLTHFDSPKENLPIPPYLLGLLLGDGGMKGGSIEFTNQSPELIHAVEEEIQPFRLNLVRHSRNDDQCLTYRLRSKERDAGGHSYNELITRMRSVGLMGRGSHDKFIPAPYLTANLKTRLLLLAGLVDTDGYVYHEGRQIEYCSMSKRLADGVIFLVRSLGGYASVKRGHVGQYRVHISLNREVPCRVPYKKHFAGRRRKDHIGITSWRPLGECECVDIAIDAPSHLFLLDNFVLTHNTRCGAVETGRAALDLVGDKRIWVVGPTYGHVSTAWSEVNNVLKSWRGLVAKRNVAKQQIQLVHGGLIEFRSADRPDNLRGPNVDACWIDEGAFLKAEAWIIILERVAATGGEIWVTSSPPPGRNWMWPELLKGGMPPAAPYGWWERNDRFVSHFPTWHFPWAKKGDIAEAKETWPRSIYNREYGAMFTSEDGAVFRQIEECFTKEPPGPPPAEFTARNLLGTDLARHQDFTAVWVMDGAGKFLHLDKWNQAGWTIQRPRLVRLAKEWNAAMMLDVSNVGDVIEEDLRLQGVEVIPIDLHDQYKKQEIVQSLQVAIEQRHVQIPDPRATWASNIHQAAYDELKNYGCTLTKGRRLSYSAPEGMNDDLVMAFCLANYGRRTGAAGGPALTTEVYAPRPEFRPHIRSPIRTARKSMYESVYGDRQGRKTRPRWSFWER